MWQLPVLTLREGKHFWLLKLLLSGWEAYRVRKQIPCVPGGWQLERAVGLVMVGRKSGVRSGLEKGLRKGRRPSWAWKEQKGGHRDVGYQGERKGKLEGRGELGLFVFLVVNGLQTPLISHVGNLLRFSSFPFCKYASWQNRRGSLRSQRGRGPCAIKPAYREPHTRPGAVLAVFAPAVTLLWHLLLLLRMHRALTFHGQFLLFLK